MKDELDRMGREGVVDYYKTLFKHTSEGTSMFLTNTHLAHVNIIIEGYAKIL
jgi:hypothetical protein